GTAAGNMAGKNAGIYRGFNGSDRAGETTGYADADGKETIDDGRCVDGCAAKALDAQSGVLTSGALDQSKITAPNLTYGARPKFKTGSYEPDGGGASRFYPQFTSDADGLGDPDAPFLYEAKAPTREKFLYCR